MNRQVKPASVRWMAPFVVGGAAVAWLFVALDYAARRDWDGTSRGVHLAASLLLYTASGTLLSLLAAALPAVHAALARRLVAKRPARLGWLAPGLGALTTLGILGRAAFFMFSGERIRNTPFRALGPLVVLLLLAGVGAGMGRIVRGVFAEAAAGRFRQPLLLLACSAAAGAVLVRVDMTVYVSLYANLHTALETSAAVLLFLGATAVLSAARAASLGARRGIELVAALVLFPTLVFVVVPPLRSWVDDSLRHAWREPVYVGRVLSRAQIVEGFVRDPRGWRGATMSSIVRLRERYDIATTTRSPIWNEPLSEAPDLASALAGIRGDNHYNVVFFYVDTLRSDVARDPRVMPNTARFAQQAVDFRRAYTTGSDTLHALPGLLRGSYDLFAEEPTDLVTVAHGAGYTSALTVARSAREFLSRLLPQFKLDETLEVSDYATGNENVWGYGADQPTAARLTDRALSWLEAHGREQPFFLWLFHFDVHNWRELDVAHVRELGRRYGLLDESNPIWRYRVVARSVDVELGRFLAGLSELGLADRTIVLFVSDHGEGLGREGFWVHSVFLWENLVHVPLMLRVPGLPRATVTEPVSLVDVAPTIARYMIPSADTTHYQGEDLLSYLVPGHPPRRLPITLMSTLKEVPVRIGLVDPTGRYKLVLPLEGAAPELYDLGRPDPDGNDVGAENPAELLGLLNQLVRCPLFPRVGEAGSGPLDEAARQGQIAIVHDAREAAEKAAAEEAARARASATPEPESPPK